MLVIPALGRLEAGQLRGPGQPGINSHIHTRISHNYIITWWHNVHLCVSGGVCPRWMLGVSPSFSASGLTGPKSAGQWVSGIHLSTPNPHNLGYRHIIIVHGFQRSEPRSSCLYVTDWAISSTHNTHVKKHWRCATTRTIVCAWYVPFFIPVISSPSCSPALARKSHDCPPQMMASFIECFCFKCTRKFTTRIAMAHNHL